MITNKKKLNVIFNPSETHFEETVSSLRLVKSLALNYPVLHYLGFRQDHGIAIITPSISKVIDILNCKGSIVLGQTIGEAKRALHKAGKYLFIFPYTPSAKIDETLEFLLTVVRSGMIDDNAFKGVVILVTNHADLSDPNRELFMINWNEADEPQYSGCALIPDEGSLPLVTDTIQRLTCEREKEFGIYRAASCFLFPDTEHRQLLEEYFSLIDRLEKENGYLHDTSGLSNIFVRAIWSSLKACVLDTIALPYLASDAHDFVNSLFYNDTYFYLSDATFKKLISEEASVGPNSIKKALAAEHILIPEPGNAKTYETNMNYLLDGEAKRISMLRFSLNKIHDESLCSFGDYISTIKEEKNEYYY